MSRGLWFAAGAGAAVYAMVRGRRAAEALSLDGLADRVNGLAVGVRMFAEEVREGRTEKETELRARLALRPAGTPELGAAEPVTGHDHDIDTDTDTDIDRERMDGHR